MEPILHQTVSRGLEQEGDLEKYFMQTENLLGVQDIQLMGQIGQVDALAGALLMVMKNMFMSLIHIAITHIQQMGLIVNPQIRFQIVILARILDIYGI